MARRFVPVAAIIIATTLNIKAAEADMSGSSPVVNDSATSTTIGSDEPDAPPIVLPDIVISVRRVEEHPLAVPAYTQVITREQISKSGTSNLIELLKSQANLSFTSLSSSPTNTKVSMRGTGYGDNNGRTLILIDGIRANRPDMGQFNWLQFAVQDIESIEVMQGPQGGYYGDNAVGGVIKINTRGVPDKSGGQVSALVGSNATVKINGGYTQRFGETWATVSGGHDESEGYRNHSDYEADSGAVSVGYDNKKNSITQFKTSYTETVYEQPKSLTLAQYHADPTQDGGGYEEGWSKTFRVSGSNQSGSKSGSRLLTDAAYYKTTEYSTSWGSLFNRTIEGGSLAPKASVKLAQGSVTPGVDFDFDKLDSVTTGASSAIGELSRYSIAPYMGGDWLVADKLSLSGVVRQQFNRTKGEGTNTWPIVERANSSDSGTAYQVAANYRPSQQTRIYGKYDHTYRFPSMDEIAYYSGFGGPPVFFNKNLMPEQSDNIELGSDYSAGFWTLGGAAYHMKTTDEIAYNAVTSLNENLARTERNGVQAHVLYDRSWIGFRGRADLVNARIMVDPINNSEGRIPMVPRWQTTGTVFARPISGFRVELTHRYIGEASASPATSGIMPSANFFDTKISYEITPSWAAYTGVNNLMDKKSMSGNYYGSIYPGEGRFMYLGSTYKF